MLTNDNNVRRNDLSLRLKYIGIKTRIFKIAPFKYVILCSNIPDDFEKIKTYFDRSIRYVTLQISLSDQVPEHYIEELSPIDMEHPVDDFRATARTRAEIEEYIYGRYHDFDIRKIVPSEGGINFHMDIYVGSDVSDKQIARLQKELTEVDFGTDQIQVLRTTDPPEDKTKLNPQDSVMWLNTNKSYPFTVAETDFWYDNIEAIYDGSVKRKDLSFCRDGELKCFVNASVFPVINLRSLLLLYDTVYLALPIENFLDEFLEMQGMKKKELVQLVSMGKVVLLLGNDETRYDRQVILDAYKESPDSVIGRRAMNAMMIAQLVEMKNQYAANYPMAYEMASQLAKYGNQKETPYTYSYYPTMYKNEANHVIDGTKTESGLKQSEQTSFIAKTYEKATTSIQPYQTYYKTTDYATTASLLEGYSNILITNGSSTNYWVASRCVGLGSSICYFSVRNVNSGYFSANDMFYSGAGVTGDSRAVFPVVSLSSQLLEKAADGTYNVK